LNEKQITWHARADDDADLPIIDEQVHKLGSFTNATADGVIERHELVEGNDAQHEKVTRVLIELSAYNIMRLLHELQSRRLETAFSKR
jgi:hypothetical protein